MNDAERSRLLDALLDGSIGDEELQRIDAELVGDPKLRETYYQRLQLHVLLGQLAGEISSQRASESTGSRSWNSQLALVTGVLIGLAASLLVAFCMIQDVDESPVRIARSTEHSGAQSAEEPENGFAVVAGQSGAVWQNQALKVGDLVPSGTVHLESGTVQLELFSGVQMVLSGDCLFSIDSAMQVTMSHGQVRTRVPEPAEGFTIKTSSGDIVDLGTEFALQVSPERSDVRVLDGEVELRGDRKTPLRVESGSAMRLSRSGQRESIVDEIKLIGPTDFQTLLEDQQKDRLVKWESKAESLLEDPRLVGHYQFSRADSSKHELENLAAVHVDPASDGAIVAAQPANDRWGRPGQALDFSHIGSRIRVKVDGEHRGLTLSAWVKINSLDRWYNSLFLTDGHNDFAPHWQIMNDGRIFFSVKLPVSQAGGEGEEFQSIYYSPPVWNRSLSGRWVMLSVTYDVENQRVMHFMNGEAISEEAIEDENLVEKVIVGVSSICNWAEPLYFTDSEFVVRNLNGSMDEFSIYSGALSENEIKDLYQLGNPNEQ